MKLRRLFGNGEGDDAGEGEGSDDARPPQADEPTGGAAELFDQDHDDVDPGDDADVDRDDTVIDKDETGAEIAASSDADDDEVDDGTEDAGDTAGDQGADDTDIVAVDEAADEDDEDNESEEEEVDDGELALFPLNEWGARERQLLDNELQVNRIRYAWEAGDLVVDRAEHVAVRDLVELIKWRTSLDLSPDVETVVYDIGDWPPGLDDKFVEELVDARIPHARGYREFSIGVADEERVDEIVERISRQWETDQIEADEPDDIDAQVVLSDLFLSADRLTHSPKNKSDAKAFEDAAATAADMDLPFGFEQSDWDALLEDVTALGDLLADEESYEDDIMDAATNLRTRLRALV